MLKSLCLILSLAVPMMSAADPTGASDAGKSTQDMSCKNPTGKMKAACDAIKEALQDPCNKELSDQLRQKAESGQMQDSQLFCSKESMASRDDAAWDSVLLDLFAGVVSKESGGDTNPPPPKEATGSGSSDTPHGLFQIDSPSVRSYKCCKDFNKSNENDPKANAKCGVGLNLENMVKCSCWAHGHGGDKSSFGVAKFQEVCRDGKPKDAQTKDDIASCTQKACSDAATGDFNPATLLTPTSGR